jgi:GrpB-like predicted nucleotidyltransferase (UPF0157 family)
LIGLEPRCVKLVPYDPDWRRAFEREKARLQQAVGEQVLEIQHVGSTAIPGVAAKPIIDIGIAVKDFEDAAACVPPIEALGYTYRGEHGIPRRHYFIQGAPLRTHHLHMVEVMSWDWRSLVLFRDTLIAHPETAAAYLALKQELARRFQGQREAYTDGKASFIEQVLRAAGLETPRPMGAGAS